jgi:hypothetical protein
VISFSNGIWDVDTLRFDHLVWQIAGPSPSPLLVAASSESLYVYRRVNGRWTFQRSVPSGSTSASGTASLLVFSEQEYYTSYTSRLYKFSSGMPELLHTSSGSFVSIRGTASNNLIAFGMDDSFMITIEHFDGVNWLSLTKALSVVPLHFKATNAWIADGRVVVIGDDGTRSYALVGK